MGAQSKQNRRADAARGPPPAKPQLYTPGAEAWKCVDCSKIDVFKNGPHKAYWVGKTHAVCNRAGCTQTPKPGSKLFGGTYLPGLTKQPPGASPTRRTAAAEKQQQKTLEDKLAASEK